MRASDVNSQVDFMCRALNEASIEALNVKEKFKTNVKRKFIPQEVGKLLRKKLKLRKRVLKNNKWTKNLELED